MTQPTPFANVVLPPEQPPLDAEERSRWVTPIYRWTLGRLDEHRPALLRLRAAVTPCLLLAHAAAAMDRDVAFLNAR